MNRFLVPMVFLSASALLTAGTIQMPPGSRSWINLAANVCVGGDAECAGDLTSLEFTQSLSSASVTSTADIGPETLKGLLVGVNLSSSRLYVSKMDTFLLSSDTLAFGTPVSLTALMEVDATLSKEAGPQGRAFLSARVGTWIPSATTENVRVFFNSGSTAPSLTIPTTFGAVNQTFNGTAARPLTAQIGVPFDLGYQLELSVIGTFTIDASHTATIGFTLPSNVTISSQDGFGNVPEPGTIWLSLSAFAALGLAVKKKR